MNLPRVIYRDPRPGETLRLVLANTADLALADAEGKPVAADRSGAVLVHWAQLDAALPEWDGAAVLELP